MREYTRSETFVANIPYVAMILLGAATIALGCDLSAWGLAGAAAYMAYGVAGAFWIIVFVCPHCAYYATKSCPCGYGTISARIASKARDNAFARQFKRHIPAIVPLWLIPPAFAAFALWGDFSYWLLGLVSAFVLNSYVVLPLLSRRHSCVQCPQKEACPWMATACQENRADRPNA